MYQTPKHPGSHPLFHFISTLGQEPFTPKGEIETFLRMSDSSVAILDLDYLSVDCLLNKKSDYTWIKFSPQNPFTVGEFIHQEDRSRLLRDIAHFRRFNLTEYESVYRLSDMEGQYFWDLVRALPIQYDANDRVIKVVVFIRHLNHAIANGDFVEQLIADQRRANARMLDRKLTAREKQVLNLIGKAMTDQEIANCMFISRKTVVTHRRNLLRKLKAKNKMELVKIVIENGLTDP